VTKFSDMPRGSINGWVLWAQSHDWGQGDATPWFDDMTGELVTYAWEADRLVEARHKTPRDMKAWAGY
jgi:hypothetical protein